MKWFRYYAEALHDPKVQQLPGELFKTWVNILSVACMTGGEIRVADLPHIMTGRSERYMRHVYQLVEIDLLIYGGGLIIPHNWYGRQYKSDNSAERVRRFRARRRNVTGNVSRVTHVTAPDKKVSKKERETVRKWVAELEARRLTEINPNDIASLKSLKPFRGH